MNKHMRILLIEDSDEDALLLLRELRRGNYEVEFERVETAAAMQSALAQKKWDLILSDYSLPEFNALQALEILKASGLDMPLIIISGTIGEDAAVDALKAGVNDFIIKGKYARLLPAIERELREVETRRERKQAEERFRLVVEAAPNAILLINEHGKIEMVNSQAERFFGYHRAELVGLDVDRLVPERLRRIHLSHRQSYLGQLETRPMGAGRDLYGVRKDGSEFPVEIGLTPIQTPEGLLVIATIVDITARKRAESMLQTKNEEIKNMSQQLWQAAKLATMGELAASIAHELNNPLATVSLRAEMLQAQFSPDDAQTRSLHVIHSEVQRMSNLVGNLLQFSRRSSSQISTIKVNEELADTLELIQYHLRKRNILTVLELSPEIPLIQADRQQLREVFLNLFTNASDAMPLGGMLTIRSWSGEKPDTGITAPLQRSMTQSLGLPVPDIPQVYIEVSDTGEGIPPDTLERVWEPFYTTKPEGKGTGLGLAICRRIIQEHGGTIEVSSDGIPGKGTTVRVSLPALKER